MGSIRFISLVSVLLQLSCAVYGDQYAGSSQCKSCHQGIYNEWLQSDHFHAMQKADSGSVAGDFGNRTVDFHGMKTRFFQRDGDYYVNTPGADGIHHDYRILHTFGFYPLQQYLVATDKGRLQALNIAWDARSLEEGGQKWFHLQPDEDISPSHPFFWTGHFSNWNSRCADCHSTAVKRGYDVEEKRYQTSWQEMNVSCEACHGPAGNHVTSPAPLNSPVTATLIWHFEEGQSIASALKEPSAREINMCGGCHSRREMLTEVTPLADYHQQYGLQTLAEGLYFADGQIEDEVFVLGSFLQSKMHRAGVTCTNCHNPHTGKVKSENNDLCAQCHLATTFDTPKHHHHDADSQGARCINCHMPATTYMQVDDRRDHSFVIPRPSLSAMTGSPDPCMNCHTDNKEEGWSEGIVSSWYGDSQPDHWGFVNYQASQYDSTSLSRLLQIASAGDTSDIIQATLLEQLARFPISLSLNDVSEALDDASPLVRRSAVTTLQDTPPAAQWTLLAPKLADPVRSVRLEAVRVLAQVYQALNGTQKKALSRGIEEYRQALLLVADTPAGQINLANLELGLGNISAVGKAYQQALLIEPDYVPALLNLADFYRSTGQDSKARSLLLQALRFAPESAAVNHSYGLFLIRAEQHDAAIPYLARGAGLMAEQTDGQPRFAYVYAIALDARGRTSEAADALIRATGKWHDQYDLLLTLVHFLEKTQRTEEITAPLASLVKLAPTSVDVQRLARQYFSDEKIP